MCETQLFACFVDVNTRIYNFAGNGGVIPVYFYLDTFEIFDHFIIVCEIIWLDANLREWVLDFSLFKVCKSL